MNSKITVVCSNALDFSCDVLVLKYAQEFYGADRAAAMALSGTTQYPLSISPSPGEYAYLPSRGRLAAHNILFLGVIDLYEFEYQQIREFSYQSMQVLQTEAAGARHIAMTMHGIGYGLDEREAFLAQIAGLLDAFRDGIVLSSLERITIVEINPQRAARLKEILEDYFPSSSPVKKGNATIRDLQMSPINAGSRSGVKPHVFVAMPYTEEMEDVYIFGIQGPVNAAGYLCERVDMSIFTGDILNRIKSRIESAILVIADLTGANANVYLEVGYAWGKSRPTLLVAKTGNELKFDVSGQRCIVYKNISDLAKKLESDLAAL